MKNIEKWIEHIEYMVIMMEVVVEKMKEKNFEREVSGNMLDWFYQEGWGDKYAQSERGFYSLNPKGVEIIANANEKDGVMLYGILGRLWRILPEFYKGHKEEGKVEAPAGYNPEIPFPELLTS